MKFLTNQEPRSLHLRSTFVGSILAGLGIGAGIALLALIAVSVNWGQDKPTNGQIFQEVAIASTIYAVGGALVFAVIGFTLHGLTRLVSKSNLSATTGASRVLAGLSGAVLGSGLWVWQLLLIPTGGGVLAYAWHATLIVITGALISAVWLGVSSLLKIRSTADGQAISKNLAVVAGVTSLFPWAYFLITLLVRP